MEWQRPLPDCPQFQCQPALLLFQSCAFDISSFSTLAVRATWTSFSPFSDSQAGLEWIWPWNCSWCSLVQFLLLPCWIPKIHSFLGWSRRVRPIGQSSSCGGEVHSEGGTGCWTWRQKISIQFKSTKCPLFRQLLINHVSMKISPFHEAVVWE